MSIRDAWSRLLLAACVLSAPAAALRAAPEGPAPESSRATLAGSIRDALHNSPDLRGAVAESAGAREVYRQALAQRVASLTSSFSYGRDRVKDLEQPHPDSVDARDIAVVISQPLFAGFGIEGGVTQARAQREAAEAGIAAISNDFGVRVAATYLTILDAERQLAIQDQRLAMQRHTLDNVHQIVSAGHGSIADEHLLQARLSRSNSERLDAEAELDLARQQFQTLVGYAPPSLAEVSPLPPVQGLSLDGAMTRARQANPDLEVLRSQANAAQAGVTVARAALYPRLDLEGGYSRHDDLDGVSPGFRDQESAHAELVARYDLSLGGVQRRRVSAASAAVDVARERVASASQRLELAVSQAWVQWQSQGKRVQELERYADLASQTVDDYEQLFPPGKRTLIELLDAANEAAAARSAHSRAMRDLRLSEVQLLSVTGGLAAWAQEPGTP